MSKKPFYDFRGLKNGPVNIFNFFMYFSCYLDTDLKQSYQVCSTCEKNSKISPPPLGH